MLDLGMCMVFLGLLFVGREYGIGRWFLLMSL